MRDAKGSYCFKPGVEATLQQLPYVPHLLWTPQSSLVSKSKGPLWLGTRNQSEVLRACGHDPTPVKRGMGSPERYEGLREAEAAGSWKLVRTSFANMEGYK